MPHPRRRDWPGGAAAGSGAPRLASRRSTLAAARRWYGAAHRRGRTATRLVGYEMPTAALLPSEPLSAETLRTAFDVLSALVAALSAAAVRRARHRALNAERLLAQLREANAPLMTAYGLAAQTRGGPDALLAAADAPPAEQRRLVRVLDLLEGTWSVARVVAARRYLEFAAALYRERGRWPAVWRVVVPVLGWLYAGVALLCLALGAVALAVPATWTTGALLLAGGLVILWQAREFHREGAARADAHRIAHLPA